MKTGKCSAHLRHEETETNSRENAQRACKSHNRQQDLPRDGCLSPALLGKSCHPYALLSLHSQSYQIGLQLSDSGQAHMSGSICKRSGRKE